MILYGGASFGIAGQDKTRNQGAFDRRIAPQCAVLPRAPLWQHATQTAFGEGPEDARVMLIGEQAGDREDIEGAPFVEACVSQWLDDEVMSVAPRYVVLSWRIRGAGRVRRVVQTATAARRNTVVASLPHVFKGMTRLSQKIDRRPRTPAEGWHKEIGNVTNPHRSRTPSVLCDDGSHDAQGSRGHDHDTGDDYPLVIRYEDWADMGVSP